MSIDQPEHTSQFAEAMSRILRIAAYPISALSGYFAGDVFLRNSIYKNFARHGFFDGKTGVTSDGKVVTARKGVQGETHEAMLKIAKETYSNKMLAATDDATLERYIRNAHKFGVSSTEEIGGVIEKSTYAGAKGLFEKIKGSLGETRIDFEEIAKNAENSVSKRFALLNDKYRVVIREFFEDLNITGPMKYIKVSNRNQKVETAVFALTAAGISLGALLTIANNRGLLDALSEKSHSHDTASIGP